MPGFYRMVSFVYLRDQKTGMNRLPLHVQKVQAGYALFRHIPLKSLYIFHLSDDYDDVSVTEPVIGRYFDISRAVMLDGNDVQVILPADIEILDTDACHARPYGDLLDLYLVIQEDKIQEIVGDEALPETNRQIMHGKHNIGAYFLQHGSLLLADSLCIDMRYAQAYYIQGSQDAGINNLANADNDSITILYADLRQRFIGQIICYDGI